MAPTTVDGLDVDDVTIDGDVVDEITMDGDVVYQAFSIGESVVEDFEHNDMQANWIGAVSSLSAETQNSEVYGGNYALKTDNSSSSQSMVYDGPNEPPVRGDRIRWYGKWTGEEQRVSYGFLLSDYDASDIRSQSDGYLFRLSSFDSEAIIRRMDGGDENDIEQTSVSWPTGTWIEYQATFSADGTIELAGRKAPDYNEQPVEWDSDDEFFSLSESDSTYDSGDIGMLHHDAFSSDPMYHDLFVIWDSGF